MQPENMLDYSSPDVMSDLSSAYENKNGVSFPFKQTPTIRAYFNAPVAISTVALQPTFKTRTTNIIKFSVFYVTLDNKPYVDPKTGQVLTFTSKDGDDSLTIQHDMINNLKGLNLTILKTSEGTPTSFRLKVLGCYKPSKSMMEERSQLKIYRERDARALKRIMIRQTFLLYKKVTVPMFRSNVYHPCDNSSADNRNTEE